MKKRLTLKMGKKERGFTLIELLIVIAILGVLAAVVVPNVMGLFGRGGNQAYGSDAQTIQTSVATFYGDVHRGPATTTGWGNYGGSTGHFFPTASGYSCNITESATIADNDENNPDNPRLQYSGSDITGVAGQANITAAAIWMGLLVNEANSDGNTTERDVAASVLHPVTGSEEESMYLTEYPKSSTQGNVGNGNPNGSGGTYTWIVGKNGKVFGAYEGQDGNWYSGFGGNYP